MTKGQWLTQTEYAKAKGVTVQAVTKMIRTGRVETNGKSGRECRVRAITSDSLLESARIEKIHADIDLQRMKLSDRVDQIRRECYDQILEEYERAFAPLKVRLIDLHLNAAQTASLRKIFDGCVSTFLTGCRARMNGSGGNNAAAE